VITANIRHTSRSLNGIPEKNNHQNIKSGKERFKKKVKGVLLPETEILSESIGIFNEFYKNKENASLKH